MTALVTFPMHRCAACGSLGCNRERDGEFYCNAVCQAEGPKEGDQMSSPRREALKATEDTPDRRVEIIVRAVIDFIQDGKPEGLRGFVAEKMGDDVMLALRAWEKEPDRNRVQLTNALIDRLQSDGEMQDELAALVSSERRFEAEEPSAKPDPIQRAVDQVVDIAAAAIDEAMDASGKKRRGHKASTTPKPPKKTKKEIKAELQANFSDADRQEMIRELVPLRIKVDAANGAYRACLKKWGNRGADLKAAGRYVNERRQDNDVLIRQEQELSRLRAVSGRWPTEQLALILPPGTKPISIGDHAAAIHNEFEIGQAGYAAGRAGKPRDDNPHHPGSPFHVIWDKQWTEGQAAIAAEMSHAGGDVTQAPPTRERRKPSAEDQPAGHA